MRQQLPPQIKKIKVLDRSSGKKVDRWVMTVDVGVDPDSGKRRQVRKRFDNETDAKDELKRTLGEVSKGTYVRAKSLSVDQACEAWLASKHSLELTTLRGHKSKLAVLRQELGKTDIRYLTKTDLDNLVGQLRRGEVGYRGKKWSARSCNYLLYLTAAVLGDQVKQGNLGRNVADLVDRVAGESYEYRTLTDKQMFAILDHECRDRHLWALALYGMRRGEVAGLRWENVNLTDKPTGEGKNVLPPKSVRICETRVCSGSNIVTKRPKSKASNRTLPMPDEVVNVLRAVKKRQAAERLAFGEGYGPGEYVASDEAGHPYHPNLLTFRWGQLLDDMKIPRVRLHDARHSCGSLMHQRQVPIATVAAWLGHASAAFTLAVYVHSPDTALKTAGGSYR